METQKRRTENERQILYVGAPFPNMHGSVLMGDTPHGINFCYCRYSPSLRAKSKRMSLQMLCLCTPRPCHTPDGTPKSCGHIYGAWIIHRLLIAATIPHALPVCLRRRHPVGQFARILGATFEFMRATFEFHTRCGMNHSFHSIYKIICLSNFLET